MGGKISEGDDDDQGEGETEGDNKAENGEE